MVKLRNCEIYTRDYQKLNDIIKYDVISVHVKQVYFMIKHAVNFVLVNICIKRIIISIKTSETYSINCI